MGYLIYLLKKFLNSYLFHVLFWYSIGTSIIFFILSTDSIFSNIVLVIIMCFTLVAIVFGITIFVKELYPEIKKSFKESYEKYLRQKNTK